jgi:dihydrodipicolinate synthase/N-acetylneuraminate lyase
MSEKSHRDGSALPEPQGATAQTRRGFLTRVATGGLGLAGTFYWSPTLSASPHDLGKKSSANFRKPMSAEDFRNALAGPIQSHPTPFNAQYELDVPAIGSIIRRGLRYKVRIFELTAGNSRYFSLSYAEIKTLTRAFVEAVGDDGLSIAATGPWWTDRAVDYARYAESVGADALQVLLPELQGGEDELVRHFESIARHTRLPLVLHGRYSESLLTRLLKIDSIVAMKEDYTLEYYVDRIIEFGKRVEIFSGGAENRYLVGYPYGARAFFSTYTSFAPDISMNFWQAIRESDIRKAAGITTRYDYPFIKRFTHPFWHATLEYFGVAKRFLRPPEETYSDEQMKEVKKFFDDQGVYPATYRTSG